MGGLVFLIIFVAIVVFSLVSSRKTLQPARDFDRVSSSGVPARGLILQAARFSTITTLGGRKFDKRSVTIDIEVYGAAPYVLTVDLLIPRGLVRALPGDTLELRVDPKDPNQIAVLGPGGFTGPWLRTLGYMGNNPFAPNPWQR